MEDMMNSQTHVDQCIEYDSNIREGLIDSNDIFEANAFFQLQSNSICSLKAKDEVKEKIINAFKLLDKDKKGLISSSDLHYVMSLLNTEISREEVESIIDGLNIDGDGYIDYLNNAY